MSTTKTHRPVWTTQTIQIAIMKISPGKKRPVKGTKEIEVDACGLFAVHKPVGQWGYGWDATHIPTGYSCLHSARTKGAAKAFCVEVAGLFDWATITTADGIKTLPSEIKVAVLTAAQKARS